LFFLVSVMLGIIALAGMVALNFVCTKNYFFNFIKKRLAEGYWPENEEQRNILEAAGLFVGNSSASTSSFVSAPSSAAHSTVDAAVQLEKLASLVEKGLMTKEEFDAQKAKLLGL
ncbi:MAG: SHOCT domain-containing protein, partial [Treponemataceae bacterium]|nr:SHOCT domain-containing protein [Treponemataceae bacterium]